MMLLTMLAYCIMYCTGVEVKILCFFDSWRCLSELIIFFFEGYALYRWLLIIVAEPHHFYAAPAPTKR
jgi:hypothetical protein